MSGDSGAMQNPSYLTKALAAFGSGEHLLTLTATEERSPDKKDRFKEVECSGGDNFVEWGALASVSPAAESFGFG